MSFNDVLASGGTIGKTVTGLGVTATASLTLQVADGTVLEQQTGITFTFTNQSHTFVSDPTYPTQVFMGVIDNGTSTDLWVDAFVQNGKLNQSDVPSGYRLIQELVWFTMAVGETDLNNTTIYRRIVI